MLFVGLFLFEENWQQSWCVCWPLVKQLFVVCTSQKGMFWLNTSIKFLYGYRSYRCCLTLAFNRAIGFSSSRTLDVKMNDPVENAKRLAAFKAVDNHVVVISF
jgi:hypothetical protein